MFLSSIDRRAMGPGGAVLGGAAVVASLLIYASPAMAGPTCTISFSNPLSIHSIYGQARETFAVNTSINSSGKFDTCANAAPGEPCWDYAEYCGSNEEVQVMDLSGFNHYHLGFTDPAIDQTFTHCFPQDPHDGYGPGFMKYVNGQCVFPNWDFEPRVLESHQGNQWIGIWTGSIGSNPGKVFGFFGITVGGSVPIQFWYLTPDNNWHEATLAPATYFVPTIPVVVIEISGAPGQVGSYEIDALGLAEQD
jgi:hypothetical protein